MKDNGVIIPDDFKTVIVPQEHHVLEYRVMDQDKEVYVDYVKSIMSPIAFNIPVEFIDPYDPDKKCTTRILARVSLTLSIYSNRKF